MQEGSCRISAMPPKHGSIKEQLRGKIDCSVHPRLVGIDSDSDLIDSDPHWLYRGRFETLSASRAPSTRLLDVKLDVREPQNDLLVIGTNT